MKYSKCDFCSYESQGKCLYPSYFRNPHNLGTQGNADPCAAAIDRMMQIMKYEIQNNKHQVEINKNINYKNKDRGKY